MIVCLCSDYNPHDAYFSRKPADMIAGLVHPPAFSPLNAAVARKHLHVWLLQPFLASRLDLQDARRRQPWLRSGAMQRAEELFGDTLNVREYLEQRFLEELDKALSESRGADDLSRDFYDSGFFPDYGFHRDEIEIRDPENKVAKALAERHGREDEPCRTVEPIAKREPEQAYRKFFPKRTLRAGGRFYRLETPPERIATLS